MLYKINAFLISFAYLKKAHPFEKMESSGFEITNICRNDKSININISSFEVKRSVAETDTFLIYFPK